MYRGSPYLISQSIKGKNFFHSQYNDGRSGDLEEVVGFCVLKQKNLIVSGVGLLTILLNITVWANDLLVAERFIDAFYSYDQSRLAEIIDAGEEGEQLLYYQSWAKAANYEI